MTGPADGNTSKGECCSSFGERVCKFITAESTAWPGRGPTGSLSYTGGEGVGKVLNISEGLWLETPGPIGSRLGKVPIESGMFSDGSDTILGHVPVQGTPLRS